jgi:hypothetical protein
MNDLTSQVDVVGEGLAGHGLSLFPAAGDAPVGDLNPQVRIGLLRSDRNCCPYLLFCATYMAMPSRKKVATFVE